MGCSGLSFPFPLRSHSGADGLNSTSLHDTPPLIQPRRLGDGADSRGLPDLLGLEICISDNIRIIFLCCLHPLSSFGRTSRSS